MNFDNSLALANAMADAAGDIARKYFLADIDVETKSDTSPVTIADREIETALRAMIVNQYPDHGIVGEEFGIDKLESPWQWVIDPIDGTKAFIAKQPTFTTLIALAKDGVPILGIIDQPITKERWMGIKDSQKNNTSSCKKLKDATVATTSTGYFTTAEKTAFETLGSRCKNIHLGGDAYSYGLLSNGSMELVVDAHMKPYDFCALRPVVENAGGIITDWHGNPLTLASNGHVIAAATPELHRQALDIMQTAI